MPGPRSTWRHELPAIESGVEHTVDEPQELSFGLLVVVHAGRLSNGRADLPRHNDCTDAPACGCLQPQAGPSS